MQSILIRVVLPGTPLFTTVSIYVRGKYQQQFGTTPCDPHIFLIATLNEAIIGTVGIEFPDLNGLLPCEKLYIFERIRLPVPANSANSVQFGRWTSENPTASFAIAYEVSRYAYTCGKEYAWMEQRKPTNIVLSKKGIVSHHLSDAKLILENVAPLDLSFYTDPPGLYIMSLLQATTALAPEINALVESKAVIFEHTPR